jgi:hypothetical protein
MNGSGSYLPAVAPSLCWRTSGELYFEVEVCEAVGYISVGFAGANFQADGVGDDEKSWAIYNDGTTRHR